MSTKRRLTVDPFYLEQGCCTSCGVPAVHAPMLFEDGPEGCVVKRQPADAHEVDRMLRVMISSELRCIRYAGNDPAIIGRLVAQGDGDLVDGYVGPSQEVKRDHAGLRAAREGGAKELADAFVAYLQRDPYPERFRVRVERANSERADLLVSWYRDASGREHWHEFSVQRSRFPEFDYLVKGPPFMVADWFAAHGLLDAMFFESSDWRRWRKQGTRLPW